MTTSIVDFSQALKDLSVYINKKVHDADALKPDDDDEPCFLTNIFRCCLTPIANQLDQYVTQLKNASESQLLETTNALRNERSSSKSIIRETKLALRLAASCLATAASGTRHGTNTRQHLSTPALAQSIIPTLINEAAHFWIAPVMKILASRDGDSNCRLYAARLFSNILTSCYPSMMGTDTITIPRIDNSECPALVIHHSATAYTWLDFVECAIGDKRDENSNRPALVAILAALYNAIIANEQCHQLSDEQDEKPANWLVQELASSTTLLRIVIGQLRLVSIENKTATDFLTDIDPDDEVNEWILLLIKQLVAMGYLQTIYNCAIGRTAIKQESTGLTEQVLPEHNLLLACLLKNQVKVFGRIDNEIRTSILFMVDQYCRLAKDQLRIHAVPNSIGNDDNHDHDHDNSRRQLRAAVMCKLIGILADYIGSDACQVAEMRLAMGQDTPFISVAGSQLAELVDLLLHRNNGIGTRKGTGRDLNMSVEEQQSITNLVRVLGNLTYQCKPNQDLLRTTLVSPKTQGVAKDESDAARNILHVLLSCTSFAWACFTLREWALVAIRNALEENDSNQALIAELQAQEAVQSESLTDMGIRVNLDSTGKVSVQPLDEHKQ
jgi:hypothetical protein